jgi:hypothetical protein
MKNRKRDDITWGVGSFPGADENEARFYDDGIVFRHTGTDRGEHHRPAQLFDDEITDPAEVLRYLAGIEIVHEAEGR